MNLHSLIAFIVENVESPISTESLSSELGYSETHFHRQVSKLTGMTPGKLVELLRIHRGCYLLHYRQSLRFTDVAILCGYNSTDSFRRGFKRVTGFTPTDFQRRHIKIENLPHIETLAALQRTTEQHNKSDNAKHNEPHILALPAVAVYAMSHRGNPSSIPVTVREFIAWRQQHKLSPSISRTYNAFWQDPFGAQGDVRVDIMCEAIRAVPLLADTKVYKTSLPAGRYAVMDIEGGDHLIQQAAHTLIDQFIPANNEVMADCPLVVQRIRFYPDVPLNQSLNRVMVLLK
ncbi:AraC family transcriptional regulator [Aestuariibacter sp. GS-14]|uniref:AraC family transcriptional regulator n=1 Tax=Aestuariibacter sp. GS-14 TaxID=2590670 RepID=UPI00112DEF24|nr:helix-turn-helix domain-containing protein [Aestuariibacter sp. GS-14]TPV59932.1 AraC family transcriptional regulator [Aestuariibacter sp. GS-14]